MGGPASARVGDRVWSATWWKGKLGFALALALALELEGKAAASRRIGLTMGWRTGLWVARSLAAFQAMGRRHSCSVRIGGIEAVVLALDGLDVILVRGLGV